MFIRAGNGSINLMDTVICNNSVTLTTGFFAGVEMSEPSAAPTNGFRIFAEDDGGGKTRLMVRFATGVSQQIAIEP